MTISYDEFSKVDFRSGTVVKAEPFPRAQKPAYKVWVDFGPEIVLGRQVVGCINLGEKNIAGFTSEFLLVGFPDQQGAICLATADPKVPNGEKLF